MELPKIVVAAFLAIAALLGGCANTGYSSASSPSHAGSAYGVIESIEMTGASSGGIGGTGIGAGAIIGGVVGGVLGHQVGSGKGQDIATAAGVVGGAVAGHQIEKSRAQQNTYRVRVRLDNGGSQTVTQQSISDLRVGDRVRIENSQVSRY